MLQTIWKVYGEHALRMRRYEVGGKINYRNKKKYWIYIHYVNEEYMLRTPYLQ